MKNLKTSQSPTIACFITSHGFGHATRAAAVMEAVLRHRSNVRFELFTTSPRELFRASVGDTFGYHAVQSDLGLVQLSPLKEDLPATCDQLDRLLPFDNGLICRLGEKLKRLNCSMVICDISPLGIAVARKAGIPSILIENFTWDWIYQGYLEKEQRFEPHIAYLAALFESADHHIQTRPFCRKAERAVTIGPIFRKSRSNRRQVRQKLGISENDPMVLVNMGGVPDRFEFLAQLPSELDLFLVIPGADGAPSAHKKNILLPTHSPFYNPDLMVAADALVGKAGYSTVAEAYQTGIPFGYIGRPQSPESHALERFIRGHLPSLAIPVQSYDTGGWIEYLPQLLNLHRSRTATRNGADDAARYVLDLWQTP